MPLVWFQKPEQGEEEVDVDSKGDELGVDKGQGDPGVGDQGVVAASHVRQVLNVFNKRAFIRRQHTDR